MPKKMMALLLLLVACDSTPARTAEAVPPAPPGVTATELPTPWEFPRSLWQTRIESEKVTCWVVTGSGTAITCLADSQRTERF